MDSVPTFYIALSSLAILGLSAYYMMGSTFSCSSAELRNQTVYDYTLSNRDGEEVNLSAYQGRVLIIVNIASF
jgi:cytochrome oxidase Cu insertion factor (SCO1/SenC/PrrC family)